MARLDCDNNKRSYEIWNTCTSDKSGRVEDKALKWTKEAMKYETLL